MLHPYLTFTDPRAAMTLYERALGAVPGMMMDGPGGTLMHAEMMIGDAKIMLAGVFEGFNHAPNGSSPVQFNLEVANCDAAFERATEAGMTMVQAPEDQFWGERMAKVKDPEGYVWGLSQKTEDLSDEEVAARSKAFMETMGECSQAD